MTKRDRLVVGLLSHYFEDENLGCEALSISNIMLVDQVADRMGIDVEYRILVNEKHPEVPLTFTRSQYRYDRYSSSKETAKHPIRLLRTKIFRDCDVVMNINAGDGFTDLYGFPRFISESYMNELTLLKKTPLIIAPQTLGPFQRKLARFGARRVLRRSLAVFSRDKGSTKLCHDLGVSNNVSEVIDVAFALPFEKPEREASPKTRVGINVSGLLYRGGYNHDNYFNLAFDYKEFLHTSVQRMLDLGHEVHLIAHVISSPDRIEDDYSAAQEVHKLFPAAVLAPRFEDPIEAKSYISGLDFFTGARMHSTIGALSSGVAVAPIGYSKKLGGLYGTLEYPYYIDARDAEWTATSAVDQLESWVNQLDLLRDGVKHAETIYSKGLEKYRNDLTGLFTQLLQKPAAGSKLN